MIDRTDRIGQNRKGKDRIGQDTSDRIGQDRTGQGRIGEDTVGRIGTDRIGQERIGQDREGEGRIGCDGMGQTDRQKNRYGSCHNYRREVEEYEGTVVYRTLLFHNSCFLRMLGKNTLNLLLTFCRSIILACVSQFSHHISHIYQFCSVIACSIVACSIIKCAITPFCNSGFYVHSSGVPERYIK